MVYDPARCDTLLIPSGPSGEHLFAITTDACNEANHLLLNVSTIREGSFHDPACIVNVGDHPFITSQSYVVYRSGQIQKAERLTLMVDGWVYKKHQPACDALVKKMLDGVTVSRFTPKFIISYLDAIQ